LLILLFQRDSHDLVTGPNFYAFFVSLYRLYKAIISIEFKLYSYNIF